MKEASPVVLCGSSKVRLYGNNPELDHETFLDEALRNDLQVIPGMSHLYWPEIKAVYDPEPKQRESL